jgi:hypothetical protein
MQVKADLIHQREIELLVPAAGPGASDVLRLLRPAAASRSANTPAPVAVVPTHAQKQAKLPRKMSSLAETSFSMSAATLEAAAASVFGSSKTFTTTAKSNTVEGLLGLSCTIGARGEVSSTWLHAGVEAGVGGTGSSTFFLKFMLSCFLATPLDKNGEPLN